VSRPTADALDPASLESEIVAPIPFPLRLEATSPAPSRRGAFRVRRPLPFRAPLPAEPPLFDWLARRLTPGEATVWAGPAAPLDRLLDLVYAGSALVRGRILLLEGANRFNPYRIAEESRRFGLDPEPVLDRIRLARAFTAYQLVALVDGWATEARRHRPTLLIAHEIPALFGNPEELPESEREPLLRHVADRLAALVDALRLPLVLTLANGLPSFPGLVEAGPRLADLVRVRPRSAGLELKSYRDGQRLSAVRRAPGQRGLEEFLSPQLIEEVHTWDGLLRPTGRRSKSDSSGGIVSPGS
jgi:hypothetical protein